MHKIFFFSKLNLIINEKLMFLFYSKIYNFMSIFYNYYYLSFYSNIFFEKDLYLFNYILLKKQNSFLKKKINLINSFYGVFQKSNRFIDRNKNFRYLNFFFKYYKIDFETKLSINTQKIIDLRKKLKKLILENRKFVNSSVFSKAVRSYKLTRWFNLLGRKKNWNIFVLYELKLLNIFLLVHFVRSFTDVIKLIKLGGIYVNRLVQFNHNYICKKGDLLELFVSKIYFIYLIKYKNISEKNIVKIKNKLFLKLKNKYSLTRSNEHQLLKLFKDNLVFKYYIPLYLEVDFLTLTVIILQNVKNFNEINFFFKKFFILYLFRLYNWKWLN